MVKPHCRSFLVALLALTGLAACSDQPMTAPSELQTTPSMSEEPGSQAIVQLRDVPAVRLDLPPLPSWMTDDAALIEAVVAEDGVVMIGFKEVESPRTIEAGGLRAAVTAATIREGLDAIRRVGEITHVLENLGAVVARVDPQSAVALRNDPLVDYIEPRVWSTVSGNATPSLISMAQTVPWGVDLVKARQAWPKGTGSGAKVLIIDTGHDQGHVDLPSVPSGNCGGTFDGCDDTGTNDHGTGVMGFLGARNNSYGVVGVAPGLANSDVYVWGACSPSTGSCDDTQIATGINQGITWGVDVINLSLEGPGSVGMSNAVASAFSADIILVASAGNNCGTCVVYPAGYSQVIGVSGVRTDKSFANTSPCSGSPFSNQGIHVDGAAPFWGMTTTPGDTYEDESDGWCGNSFATPHVAGTAALIRAHKPTLANYKIYDRIRGTAQDLGSSGWDQQYGDGLLSTYAAMGPWSDIDGPYTAAPNQTCMWTENVVGGYGTMSYKWYKNGSLVSTTWHYTANVGSSSFTLELEATDSQNFIHRKTIFVEVSSSGGCPE